MAELRAGGGVRVGVGRGYGPAVVVTRRGADRLREGHLWVYRSEVVEAVPGLDGVMFDGGALVSVVDGRGIALGSALYSDASEIVLRVVSGVGGLSREAYLGEVRERVGAAIRLRREVAAEAFLPGTDALRLVFGEADGLPGIVADRYNNLVVIQLLTQGTAGEDVRGVVVEALREALAGEVAGLTILERPDARVRELERLPAVGAEALFSAGDGGAETVFSLNGVRFHFDAGAGQKTGAFLDQRLNYAAAARHGRGEALDVCTYQGGFALHLARACRRVTGVDASRAALGVADRNLELNPGLGAEVDWIEADAFELLREFEGTGRRYDTMVLDPPAFAKTRRAVEGAMRGYKEMNLRAMKMLRDGGTLVTCSCSHHVGLEEFMEVVRAAAVDAGRRVQVLETRGAAPDHPAMLTLAETAYLKCLVLRVG